MAQRAGREVERETSLIREKTHGVETEVAREAFDFYQGGMNGGWRVRKHNPCGIGKFEPLTGCGLNDRFDPIAHVRNYLRDRYPNE